MRVSKEVQEAYAVYRALHRRFEDDDMDVASGDVHAAYMKYVDVHNKHDALQGYSEYNPYSIARRA